MWFNKKKYNVVAVHEITVPFLFVKINENSYQSIYVDVPYIYVYDMFMKGTKSE